MAKAAKKLQRHGVRAGTSVVPSQSPVPAELLFNRELSWIEFNRRVLEEALDESHPLLERLKFLAIFSTNLDEFFMIRVSGLKEELEEEVVELSPDGKTPAEQLKEIGARLRPLVEAQMRCLKEEILPRLEQSGVRIISYKDLGKNERQRADAYFMEKVFPILTPQAVDPGHPFPYVSNLSLNLGLLVEPGAGEKAAVNLRERTLALIGRETEHAKAGRPASIIVKVNSLTDLKIIRALYEASRAGVSIDLLVRGVCMLRPGIEGVSENIRVRSIVGRFLEHSRVFYFQNGGAEEVYIGSADWMHRNLDRRVEVVVPVKDQQLRKYLRDVLLDAYLRDDVKTRRLNADGSYARPAPGPEPFNSQGETLWLSDNPLVPV